MARPTILLTGSTGALGEAILATILQEHPSHDVLIPLRSEHKTLAERVASLHKALLTEFGTNAGDLERLRPIEARFELPDFGFPARIGSQLDSIEAIVHAAAETRLKAAWQIFERSNISVTTDLLALAAQLPNLSQFVFLSTASLSGKTQGSIGEQYLKVAPEFDNDYQKSKFLAEQYCERSSLPMRTIRLSTAIGHSETGYVGRLGAFHYLLTWLYRGLVPLVPGKTNAGYSTVDIISTNQVAKFVSHCLTKPPRSNDVVTFAAGERAPTIIQVLDHCVELFAEFHPAWKRRLIPPPVVSETPTFDAFRQSVIGGGDPTLGRILETSRSFISALEFPRTYHTTKAAALWGAELPVDNWQQTLENTIRYCAKHAWSRLPLRG